MTTNKKHNKQISYPVPSFLKNVPWGNRDVIAVIVWTLIIAPLLAVFITGLLGAAIPDLKRLFPGDKGSEDFITPIWGALTIAGVIFIARRKKSDLRTLGFKKFKVKPAIVIIILAIVLTTAASYVLPTLMQHLISGYDPAKDPANVGREANWHSWWLVFVGTVIVAPVMEETLFRGFLFPVLARRFGLVAGAIIISVAFGLLHFSLIATPLTIIAGLILCYMYTRLESIVPGILLHIINNTIAAISAMPN